MNRNRTIPTDPTPLSELVKQKLAAIDWEKADQQEKERARAVHERDQRLEQQARESYCDNFWVVRGKRYRRCTLDNFEATTEDQQKILQQVRNFAAHLDEEIRKGTNLLISGKYGTGKDHLVAALTSLVLAAGRSVRWTTGERLFEKYRVAIARDEPESIITYAHTEVDLLIISDPCIDRKPLTDQQRKKLSEIIDMRYSDLRPTWMTINVKDTNQAIDLVGKSVIERLRDDAVTLVCAWDSYRRPRPAEVTG